MRSSATRWRSPPAPAADARWYGPVRVCTTDGSLAGDGAGWGGRAAVRGGRGRGAHLRADGSVAVAAHRPRVVDRREVRHLHPLGRLLRPGLRAQAVAGA